jgi:hypothetical protein
VDSGAAASDAVVVGLPYGGDVPEYEGAKGNGYCRDLGNGRGGCVAGRETLTVRLWNITRDRDRSYSIIVY